MLRHQWMRVLPLVVLATVASPRRAGAAGIRDRAGMFSAATVRNVETRLDQIEKRTGIPIVFETIDAIPDLDGKPGPAIERLAEKRAHEIGYEGAYLLISKKDHVFSRLLVQDRYASILPRQKRLEVRDALVSRFKNQEFDKGLEDATAILDRALAQAPARAGQRGVVAHGVQRNPRAHATQFGVGSLLMIGLGIFGVLVLFRVLGGLFNRGGGYQSGMGVGGMNRPGMGPGYGGPPGDPGYGYGAPRGGGFFSGMLGGLGGALAGNWLYDQFSGRHGGSEHTDAASYQPGEAPYEPTGGTFVGGDDDGGGGTSWDDPGTGDTGGDWGGGDWGGGDGGGDWGGGGDGGGW
ncbi:MAG: TPM domain-containing protein [Isosphaeraceae bacterium]